MSQDRYIEAERRLAELLYPEMTVVDAPFDRLMVTAGNAQEPPALLPQWTRCWTACGPLLTAHGMHVMSYDDYVVCDCVSGPGDEVEVIADYIDHGSRETAIRYAIVLAVIAKLEAVLMPVTAMTETLT